jgi:2-polyprenyl-3-methyl-5-hydroxy-6-metoxy-1,4-benzoquinol methylase
MSQEHWERIYRSADSTRVSWYQPTPHLSLELIRRVAPDPAAAIIDVGGGASTLVDGLLGAGYRDLTVLDLAPSGLAVARQRLGESGAAVRWVAGSILEAELPEAAYDVWHDRAVFHFLTDTRDRASYVALTRRAVRPGGHVVVASFGPEGPLQCSGLEVARYSPDRLHAEFGAGFTLLDSVREDHRTPSGVVQAFVYCLCRAHAT